MSAHKCLHYIVCLLTGLLFSWAAHAAESAEPVVVRASRVPIAPDQSGSAITVIDGVTLDKRQLDTAYAALAEVPGIAVSRTGSLGQLSQIRLRGGEANHVLVLIDGVEANDPAVSSEFNFAHLLSADIARIEVLRGPQSALYGADAVSGVVNIVTVAPSAGAYAKGSVEGGSFGAAQTSLLADYGTDRASVVLDASYLSTAGINIARTGSEKDGYRNLTASLRGRLALSDDVELSLTVRHVSSRSEFDAGFPYPVDSNDYTDAAQTYAHAEGSDRLMDGALAVRLGAALTHTLSKDFSLGAEADNLTGQKVKFDAAADYTFAGWGADQRLSVLVESERETFRQHYVGFSAADQHQAVPNAAFAGEWWLGFSDTLYLSLGLRHDWNRLFADSTTWRASLSAPFSFARLHASAGTGVKNPDFYELFGFVPSTFTGNPALKPERSLGYDAGLAFALPRGTTLDVTYFHADLENEIYTDFAVYPNTARNARGRSKRSGVELSLAADVSAGLSLQSAYTYTDSTAAGVQELRRPHHIASADLDYRFDSGAGFLTLGVDYHGAQKDTDFGSFKTVTLPAYTLVRVAGSYALSPRVKLTARIENALNAHYEEVVGYRTRGIGAFAGIDFALGD